MPPQVHGDPPARSPISKYKAPSPNSGEPGIQLQRELIRSMIRSRAMNTTLRGASRIAWIAVAGTFLLGCDDARERSEDVARKENQAATPPPEPVPELAQVKEPEPEPEPPKPKKTLEDCPKGGSVVLDSEEMEGAIRVKAQKREGDLTTADLRRIRSLNLSRVSLDELDICLFHHMTELRELFLGPGKITDLGPISRSTKLESFGASRNPIKDLSPLAAMKKMDRLDLAYTKVEDLSALEGMTALTELNIDETPVSDLSPLTDLKGLERLSIKRTQVGDLQALSDHKALKFIYINGSPVSSQMSKTGVVVKNGTKVMTD